MLVPLEAPNGSPQKQFLTAPPGPLWTSTVPSSLPLLLSRACLTSGRSLGIGPLPFCSPHLVGSGGLPAWVDCTWLEDCSRSWALVCLCPGPHSTTVTRVSSIGCLLAHHLPHPLGPGGHLLTLHKARMKAGCSDVREGHVSVTYR